MGVNTKRLLLGTSLVPQIKDSGNLYPLYQSPMKAHCVRVIQPSPIYQRVHCAPVELN